MIRIYVYKKIGHYRTNYSYILDTYHLKCKMCELNLETYVFLVPILAVGVFLQPTSQDYFFSSVTLNSLS